LSGGEGERLRRIPARANAGPALAQGAMTRWLVDEFVIVRHQAKAKKRRRGAMLSVELD
jgi:hypothetical protein